LCLNINTRFLALHQTRACALTFDKKKLSKIDMQMLFY
jgi:hypothetical protein